MRFRELLVFFSYSIFKLASKHSPSYLVGLDVLIVDLKYYTSIFLDFVQNLPCLVFIPVTLILVTTSKARWETGTKPLTNFMDSKNPKR